MRQFINPSILTKQQGYSPSFKILNNDAVNEDLILISELFNDYFVKTRQFKRNKTTNLLNLDLNLYLKNNVFTTIVLSSTQPAELFDIINSLNHNKACGYDNISSYFLCLGAEILAPILSVCFKLALELGIFPQTFKATTSSLSISPETNFNSSSKPINIGVPQRSILCPLLFLVYVNGISNATSCNPRLFADDTCLLLSNSSKPVQILKKL